MFTALSFSLSVSLFVSLLSFLPIRIYLSVVPVVWLVACVAVQSVRTHVIVVTTVPLREPPLMLTVTVGRSAAVRLSLRETIPLG